MIAGRPDNYYWGAMIAPCMFIGLAFAPMAAEIAVGAARLHGNCVVTMDEARPSANDGTTYPAGRRRRHRRLQELRTRPPDPQGRRRGYLRAYRRRGASSSPPWRWPRSPKIPSTPRCGTSGTRSRWGTSSSVAGGRSGGRLPGDRRHARQDGGRHRRRSGDHAAAGDRQAGAGRARDERADVAARRDRPQCRHAARRRGRYDGPGRGRDGLRRIRPGPPARAACRVGPHCPAAGDRSGRARRPRFALEIAEAGERRGYRSRAIPALAACPPR